MASADRDGRLMDAAQIAPPIAVRTTKRRGRLGSDARRVLVEVAPQWSLDGAPNRWSPDALTATFGRSTDRLLDIGPGAGEATRAWAAAHPDRDAIAVELHRPGIARLVRDLEATGLANVRVIEGDAVEIIGREAVGGSLADVRILFPDPWPKRRHHGRRLVDAWFVARVADLLGAGGHLHVATDWPDYADQVIAALAGEPRFVPVGPSWTTPRPDRPVTRYEARALEAGREVVDLMARRTERRSPLVG